jgi:endonuclease/exonuclease/phosphatase (EEP) superfamily protein YafD
VNQLPLIPEDPGGSLAPPRESLRPERRGWGDWVADRLLVFSAVLVIGTGGCGSLWWMLDLWSHFWPFFGLSMVPVVLWQGTRRRWGQFAWAVALTLVWLWPLRPYVVPRNRPSSFNLRIVVANLFAENPTPEVALQFLREQDADVFVLLEVDAEWMTHLTTLSDNYPFGKILPREDNFGLAVLSRRPLESVVQKRFGTARVPTLIAELTDPPLRILATHPLPPMGATNTAHRDSQLTELAELCAAEDRATVIAGDLNITPWSSTFRNTLTLGRLADSAWGLGIQPTWPTWTPVPLIPIDHLLTNRQVQTVRRHVGPTIGSDHRPVVIDVAVSTGGD